MKKKILSSVLVVLFLMTGFTAAQSVPTSSNHANDEELLDTAVEELLDAITLGEFVDQLRTHIHQRLQTSPYKPLMLSSLDNGIQCLERLGITRDTTLLQIHEKAQNGLFGQEGTTYHPFLIGILPIQTTVSTVIPPFEQNLSAQNPFEPLSATVELFIKIIPFIDRITVRHFLGLALPRLTQSAVIWPTVGGRIKLEGFTVFILAFGPRIKWTRA